MLEHSSDAQLGRRAPELALADGGQLFRSGDLIGAQGAVLAAGEGQQGQPRTPRRQSGDRSARAVGFVIRVCKHDQNVLPGDIDQLTRLPVLAAASVPRAESRGWGQMESGEWTGSLSPSPARSLALPIEPGVHFGDAGADLFD